MNYRVTVVTPTLVGDGSKLSPIDYMVWRDQVNVLDQNRIFRLLSKGPRLEGYLTQLRKATKLDFASWGGFAQNYAGRRIPFEDAACASFWDKAPIESLSIPTFATTQAGPFLPGAAIKGALRTAFVFANVKSNAIRDVMNKVAGERSWRRPAEQIEHQTAGSGGSDRLRVVSVADSANGARDAYRVYMLRLATLVARGPQQYALGWKQAGRGAVDGKRPEDGTPSFAEMAAPGTAFEGVWRENAFLNREEVRQVLRWSAPVTRERLFEAANKFAEKQLDLHAQYAQWTGLEALGASVADLRHRLQTARDSGGCLLAIGWGTGFLSKSAIIGASEEDYRTLLGALPYYERAIKSGLPFPKTRRVVFLKNKPAALPGWVELERYMTAEQIRRGIAELGPWFYRFEFAGGLETTPAIPPAVVDIFDTRLRMLMGAVDRHFGDRLRGIECLDIGCHEGFYSLAMARRGVRKVIGVDAREENLRRARFVAEGMGVGGIEYRRACVETLAADVGRTFPLTLFLGVLYHVEDPMRCLRQVAAVTDELCVIETQVVDEVEGVTEWGAREWTRPYQGILAIIDETGEFDSGIRETGITPMATCPSPRALLYMLKQAGFRRAEILPPPPGAYEQHARGKRVVCAAWK